MQLGNLTDNVEVGENGEKRLTEEMFSDTGNKKASKRQEVKTGEVIKVLCAGLPIRAHFELARSDKASGTGQDRAAPRNTVEHKVPLFLLSQ